MSLSAGEVGGLLMNAWGLPEALVNDVRAIDRVLVTPHRANDTVANRPASRVSYLCARLGERLATGQMQLARGLQPLPGRRRRHLLPQRTPAQPHAAPAACRAGLR